MSENMEQDCACGGTCGCGGHHHQEMISREDYVSRLEQYLADLRAEIEAVEAELSQIRQEA
jgi:hypothetical protein